MTEHQPPSAPKPERKGRLRKAVRSREEFLKVAEHLALELAQDETAAAKNVFHLHRRDEKCLQVAYALVSGGAATEAILGWCERAVSTRLRFQRELQQKARHPLYNFIEPEDVELLGAADLIGKAGALIGSARKLPLPAAESPYRHLLFIRQQLMRLFTGEELAVPTPEVLQDLRRCKGAWDVLLGLIEIVGRADRANFGRALGSYLLTDVARQDRRAREVGNWSLFGVAMCRRLGGVPAISEKARRYLPPQLTALAQTPG